MYISDGLVGELLPVVPLQSFTEALDHRPCVPYSINHVHLVGEAWGTTMAWHDVPRPLMQWFLPFGGFYPKFASIFPAQDSSANGFVFSLCVMTLRW